MYQVNVAFQLLPSGSGIDRYAIIDDAIQMIKDSGLVYKVCPFETVLEGDYDEIMNLIKQIQLSTIKAGATDLLSNLKIQMSSNKNIFIRDKMGKYE